MFSFSSLPSEDQLRLRRIHHMTSADMALKILRSQNIWSNDEDDLANFSLNQDPVDRLDLKREVSLGFYFDGPIELVNFGNPPASLATEVLYVYVTKWPWQPTLDGMRTWAARLKPGSSKHLMCEHAAFVRDYAKLGQTHPYARLVQRDIHVLVANKARIKVPSRAERAKIKAGTPDADYSRVELLQAWLSIKREQLQAALAAVQNKCKQN